MTSSAATPQPGPGARWSGSSSTDAAELRDRARLCVRRRARRCPGPARAVGVFVMVGAMYVIMAAAVRFGPGTQGSSLEEITETGRA